MTKILCIRSQHSRGSSSRRFGGPDTYVAVQVVPDGVEPLSALRSDVAEKRGIQIVYFGEGYRKNSSTSRSMLGQAIESAQAFIDESSSVGANA